MEKDALTWAAEGGHEAVVRLLLEKGADIEAKDEFEETALIKAAEYGYEAIVRLLLEKGADIEAKDKCGRTALIRVAWYREAVVRLLLEKGVNVKAKDHSGETALIKADKFGCKAVVRLLTPLDDSCENGYIHSTSANHRAFCGEP